MITDQQKPTANRQSEEQKAYKAIYEEHGIDCDEEQISGMTRREASELISSHTGEWAE
jgi:hypothetical protein